MSGNERYMRWEVYVYMGRAIPGACKRAAQLQLWGVGLQASSASELQRRLRRILNASLQQQQKNWKKNITTNTLCFQPRRMTR